MPQSAARRGFSAIELLVVMAIVAILAALAAPSFRDLIQNQRITTAANDFFAAVNLTRSEAVKRGGRVDLVPADGANWAKGWTVYVDQNDNRHPDSGDKIIFSHGPVPDGMTIISNLPDPQYLAYNGTGRTQSYADAQQSRFGHFLFTIGTKNRKLFLNFLGRPRVCDPAVDKTTC